MNLSEERQGVRLVEENLAVCRRGSFPKSIYLPQHLGHIFSVNMIQFTEAPPFA
jgi:hypothetical protein